MNEFNNRIDAQRQILQLINNKDWHQEELFGLSGKAIERWITNNQINPNSYLVTLIRDAASKLFFLANKSQEQVSEEYKLLSNEISIIHQKIEIEINNLLTVV